MQYTKENMIIMSKFLINTTETYRVDSEPEVEALIAEAKNSNQFVLSKYNCQYKETKQKGEVIDSWYRVTLVKEFNKAKEPMDFVDIIYKGDGSIVSAF